MIPWRGLGSGGGGGGGGGGGRDTHTHKWGGRERARERNRESRDSVILDPTPCEERGQPKRIWTKVRQFTNRSARTCKVRPCHFSCYKRLDDRGPAGSHRNMPSDCLVSLSCDHLKWLSPLLILMLELFWW